MRKKASAMASPVNFLFLSPEKKLIIDSVNELKNS
jgi:hypothetical protein